MLAQFILRIIIRTHIHINFLRAVSTNKHLNSIMEDYFTVVAIIIKRGAAIKEVYAFVPHQWVENESVFLPPHNRLTLRDDPSSAPEPEWKEFKCEIKKDFIVRKEEAERWEKEYKVSCTESEETILSINRLLLAINNNNNKIMAKTIDKTNIDALFDNIAASTSNANINAAGSTNIESKGGILVQKFGDDTSNAANVPISKNQEEVSLNTIFKKLLTIEERQLEMQASENLISERLNKICNMINNLHGTIPKPTTSHEEFENKFSFPLNTVSDVQALDSEIKENADYKNYLINTFEIIGGTEGKEDGNHVAKSLLDQLFTQEVLAKFSWTGISRTTGVEKEEFKSLTAIFDFFTEIVRKADLNWNALKNEKLLKKHIKKQKNKA